MAAGEDSEDEGAGQRDLKRVGWVLGMWLTDLKLRALCISHMAARSFSLCFCISAHAPSQPHMHPHVCAPCTHAPSHPCVPHAPMQEGEAGVDGLPMDGATGAGKKLHLEEEDIPEPDCPLCAHLFKAGRQKVRARCIHPRGIL